ncbi:Coronin-1C [Blattella germanica]|nr:Coronin-1C [Blattella germanica]
MNAICFATDNGLKVTVEDSKCIQASAFIQKEVFQKYILNDEQVAFKINLSVLVECLNIFGGTATALKMCYQGYGYPLTMLLEENGVITDCSIKTLEPEDVMDFNFAASNVLNKIILRSECLKEVFAELDTSSDLIEILLSPDPPYFRISTSGVAGDTKMSFRVVRSSKFRHVYGSALKREQCYDNIRVSKSSWDSTFCAVNPKFLAIIVESAGGGAFIVLPLSKVGRIAADHPLVGGHKGPVLDIAWCPHNDNVIASGSEDCVVKVWQIPDSGISRTLTEPVVDLLYHQRRVGLVLWHPTAQNVLLTAAMMSPMLLCEKSSLSDALLLLLHSESVGVHGRLWYVLPELVLNDRRITSEAVCHEGSKATRALFLKSGLIFTTGFSKMSERQYSLRAPEHLQEPIVMVELDTSNGVMFPLYDPDTNLVYLCGKGDSVIRYFEITAEPPFVHYINTFQTPDPQRGIGMMPKRGCDVNSCEISRFFRLNNSGLCQVITMTVPRKSELFQEDLYPDTPGDQPALSAEDWIAGKDAEPILISLKDGYVPSTQKSDLKDKFLEEFHEEIRKLKAVIVKHETRIRALEARLTAVSAPGNTGGEEEGRVGDGLGVGQPPNKGSTESVNNTHTSPPMALSQELAPDEV